MDGGFIFATNVHNTLATLAGINETYNYELKAGGVLLPNGLTEGNMEVDFSTGRMEINLITSNYHTYNGQGNAAQFYNNSISLQDTQNDMLKGSITGRFVGLNAEGAITFYTFDSGSIDPITGVGFFDRTGVITP